VVLGRHVLDKVFEGFVDAGVLVGGNDERVTFLLKNCGGTVGGGVDDSDYFETETEFTLGWDGSESE